MRTDGLIDCIKSHDPYVCVFFDPPLPRNEAVLTWSEKLDETVQALRREQANPWLWLLDARPDSSFS